MSVRLSNKWRVMVLLAGLLACMVVFWRSITLNHAELDPRSPTFDSSRAFAKPTGMVSRAGREYSVFESAPSPWYVLSSGPAVYIQDESGHVVDWTADIGDDPDFRAKWRLP